MTELKTGVPPTASVVPLCLDLSFASYTTKMREEDAGVKRAMLGPRLFTRQTSETKDGWRQHH